METIITKKDGVGAYGLFVDYIWYNVEDGALLREERRFLASNLICFYSRAKGDKRAAWKVAKYDDHDAARAALLTNLERTVTNCGVEMIGHPLLIELAATDVLSIEKNEAPYARHTGTTVIEKEFGKLNDDTWKAEAFR
jgi:hypothetical protein